MISLITKIWSNLISRRIKKFSKSPIITTNSLEKIQTKYFRLRSKSKVISVGNISFGGTGKTPLIIKLVQDFLPNNLKIGIVAKGYKRSDPQDLVLTQENINHYTIRQIGDEPLMLFNRLKLPIAISDKKYRAVANLEKAMSPDIIIIDDGYQHLWIERDIDILMLDNKILKNLDKKSFIFAREPLSSINRADILMLPIQQNETAANYLSNFPNIIHFYYELDKINKEFSFDEARNNYIAFAGIANPERFFNSLYEHNIDPISKIKFSDHYNYKPNDIEKLIKIAKRKKADLITTEKDFVKIMNFKSIFEKHQINLFCLYIKIEIIEKELFSHIIQEKLNA